MTYCSSVAILICMLIYASYVESNPSRILLSERHLSNPWDIFRI